MQSSLIVFVIVGLIGFVLSRLLLTFCKTGISGQNIYKVYKDTSVWLALLIFGGVAAIFYNAPVKYDIVAPVAGYVLPIIFALATVIYVSYWFANSWLLNALVLTASAAMAMILTDNIIFEGILPVWADKIIAAAVVYILVISAKNINLLAGTFGIQAVAITIGAALLALLGGVPIYLGIIGAYLAGVWLGFLNLNRFPSKVYLNGGACMAFAYVLAWIVLQGACELAAPSMFILCMYVVSESLWALAQRIVFNVKNNEFSENTASYSAFEKGLEVTAIGVAVAKINIVNLVLALFQLYSVNTYSVPLFAFLINLWLLGILYNVDDDNKTLKEVNREFVQSFKDGLDNIKKSLKKNKD